MSDGRAIDVVKRRGARPSESFDRNKLHASIVASCRSVRTPEGHAHDTATKVCERVVVWTTDKPEITSDDIRRQAATILETFHPEAAYLYRHHRVIM